MKQTIEIEVPEGYEAKYNSTLNKIELVKKDVPRNWKSFVGTMSCANSLAFCCNENEDEIDATLALIILRRLRKAWIGDWEPDYTEGYIKHIHYWPSRDKLEIDGSLCPRPLSFPSRKMAEEFMECFEDLLLTAKYLI